MPPTPPAKTTKLVSSIIDNPLIQDVFVDEAAGFHRYNGNLRITFTTLRADHTAGNPAPTQRVIVGRLVMPLNTAEALQKGLAQFLEQAKKQLASGGSTSTVQ
ncbi:MAG: hypothetical protein WCD70_05980 [Alphaproteobacteria bacterium]